MKLSLVAILVGLTAVLAYPANEISDDLNHEWVLIPDNDWNLHLVNIKDVEFEEALAQRAPTVAEFILFTRANPKDGQILVSGDLDALANSNFNSKNPTRFISHGWHGSRNSNENAWIRDKYLKRGEYNIIVVDWNSGADTNYIAASKNTMEAGKQVAELIDFLNEKAGLRFETLYLIGHSLGAHVVGTAGKQVTRGKINTIFGLDAAMPLFTIKDSSKRLATGDAHYVESIHTNAGQLGFNEPLGDASFYPNWGTNQPGCSTTTSGCSHTRSCQYFAESLETVDDFDAEQCQAYSDIVNQSCDATGRTAKMGGEPSNYGRGVNGEFYLPTNSDNPFAIGSKWMNK